MKIVLMGMVLLVLSTIGMGIRIYTSKENSEGSKLGRLKRLMIANVSVFAPLAAMAILFVVPDIVYAATAAEGGLAVGNGLGFIAAGLSTGMATIGAGYAVGSVGSSALGAVSEDEKLLGKTLIFVGLAEGIAIYGLIISILILGRL